MPPASNRPGSPSKAKPATPKGARPATPKSGGTPKGTPGTPKGAKPSAAPLAATEPAPAVADVRPGDLLYLPAGWVHEVHQAPRTFAVNWWFGARCDGPRWAGAELARRVGELRSAAPS